MNMFNKKKETPVSKILKNTLSGEAYSDLKQAKLMYRMTIAALSIAILILVIMLQGKKTEVVVMPPDYYEPVIVDGSYANRSYTASHALAIAVMLGNISPRNVDFVTEKFMKMLSPRLQSMLYGALDTEAKLLLRKRARQTFEVDDVMFRNEDNLVWVWGTKTTMVGPNSAKDSFTYEFRLEPNNGIPKITHFDAYPGKPNIKRQGLVEVTPYLSRDLALVKLYSPGDIKIIQHDKTTDEKPAITDEVNTPSVIAQTKTAGE